MHFPRYSVAWNAVRKGWRAAVGSGEVHAARRAEREPASGGELIGWCRKVQGGAAPVLLRRLRKRGFAKEQLIRSLAACNFQNLVEDV